MPFTNTTPSLPFQSQSATSRDAAIRAQSIAGRQAATILGWFALKGAHGGTQREVSEECGYQRASVCARVNELEKAGLIVKSVSERREHCAVYVINEGR